MRNYNLIPKNKEKKRLLDKKYGEKNKVKRLEKAIKWQQTHKSHRKEYLKNYYQNNKTKIDIQNRKWEKDHKEVKNKYNRNKCLVDVNFKLKRRLRRTVYGYIKKNSKRSSSAVRDLGCTTQELIKYFESQFKEGMTWQNWTKNGWHIDHIVPLSWFDLSNREQFLVACHYTNLQPLWAKDNIKKSNKLL